MIRRRRRWFRRTMVGLAFAVIAAPASARPFDEGGNLGSADAVIVSAGGWSGAVDARTGIPLSAGIGAELGSSVRPDDRAERFVVSGGETEAVSTGSSFNWAGAAGIAGTALGLALLLGIATTMRRRPYLAGS